MVVKMMKWRPWPPLATKKYEARLVVRRLEGCDWVCSGREKTLGTEALSSPTKEAGRLAVEIRWKGPKIALSSLRQSVRRNFTKEEEVGSDGVVAWDEEFQCVCNLSACKDNAFLPWEVGFTVLNGLKRGTRSKHPASGVASLNLSEYASMSGEKEIEVALPLTLSIFGADYHPSLSISLSLLELRTSQELGETIPRSLMFAASPPQAVENFASQKDELSAIKAGFKKVKIFVSSRRAKKAFRDGDGSEGRSSSRSEDGGCTSPFDSDLLDDSEEAELDEVKGEDSSIRKSFNYGTLAYANCAGSSLFSGSVIGGDGEGWIYYSNRKLDISCSPVDDLGASVPELSAPQGSKRSILPWRKRKLGFRSPKARGEPLLKKAYAEDGGDDIDFDRRQLSSDESLPFGLQRTVDDSVATRSSMSEFGDDSFAVGCWEHKEVMSRDGHMKLQTQVFFASIDQRSEQAAGESACTALVAVIADWFHVNPGILPIKSQFDDLIRDGSLEWRNLCENQAYREQFPDRHFDLETVLQAKIRPLATVPGKSFIGFFHPEGIDESRFGFLHDAMSFDAIWDEITRPDEPRVYIVSWNDHFFVLKVEPEAFFIIDTLGERLHEGCRQAYMLRFDGDTSICRVRQQADEKAMNVEEGVEGSAMDGEGVEEAVCSGKECCKEYIKSFLAAIPVRELEADLKRGFMPASPLHQRLQIEFQFVEPDAGAATPASAAMEIAAAGDALHA